MAPLREAAGQLPVLLHELQDLESKGRELESTRRRLEQAAGSLQGVRARVEALRQEVQEGEVLRIEEEGLVAAVEEAREVRERLAVLREEVERLPGLREEMRKVEEAEQELRETEAALRHKVRGIWGWLGVFASCRLSGG